MTQPLDRRFRYRLRRSIRYYGRTWRGQLLLWLGCVAIVLATGLNTQSLLWYQPFRMAEPNPLGANLIRSDAPPSTRLARIRFSWPAMRGMPLEFAFPLPGGDFVDFRFTDESLLRVYRVREGEGELDGTAAAGPGAYELDLDERACALRRDGAPIRSVPGDFSRVRTAYMRIGDRQELFKFPKPKGIALTFVGLHAPEIAVEARYSNATRAAVILAIALMIYLVLVFLPSVPVVFLRSDAAARGLQIVSLSILPLVPLVFSAYQAISLRSFIPPTSRKPLGASEVTFWEDEAIPPKPPGETRLLLIGGSAAKGVPLTRAQSSAAEMNKIAAAAGRPVRVVNIAHLGTDFRSWADWLPRAIPLTDPDAVLVWASFNSFSRRLIRTGQVSLFALGFYLPLVSLFPDPPLVDLSQTPKVVADLDALRAAVGNGRIPLLVIDDPVAPWFPPSLRQYHEYRLRLNAALAQRGVPVLPLYDRFRERDSTFWFHDICHLTVAGYREAARMIWDDLDRLGMLPPGRRPVSRPTR